MTVQDTLGAKEARQFFVTRIKSGDWWCFPCSTSGVCETVYKVLERVGFGEAEEGVVDMVSTTDLVVVFIRKDRVPLDTLVDALYDEGQLPGMLYYRAKEQFENGGTLVILGEFDPLRQSWVAWLGRG